MHAALALPELQRRFLAALYDDALPGPVAAISSQGLEPAARLRVYRHSCAAIHRSALRTTYPAVLALVGEGFFEQTVAAYRRASPSASGNLQNFGADFAEYLARLPALDAFPYLPDIARLEWQRQRTVLAADAAPVPAQTVAQQMASATDELAVGLHPSVHLLTSRHPLLTIWRYATAPTSEALKLSGTAEPVVLWRAAGDVAMASPDSASFACIDALARGSTLRHASAAGQACDPEFDGLACIESLAAQGLIVTLKQTFTQREDIS